MNLFERLSTLIHGGGGGRLTASDSTMMRAIRLWLELYRGDGGESDLMPASPASLRIPAFIASELARLATVEFEISVGGSPRADFIAASLQPLLARLRQSVEYACAGGGVVFKPYEQEGSLYIDIIGADRFLPLRCGGDGMITDALFVYGADTADGTLTRLERHELSGGVCSVTNTLWRGDIAQGLYEYPAARAAVPAWEDIAPQTSVSGLDKPLFSYFKMPQGNTIDPSSPLGVSVFSRAVGLIREADAQFARLLWEFEGGELAVDASEDLFRRDRHGFCLPAGKERLFRLNSLDSSCDGDALRVFSPALRDASLINGLDTIMMRIEDVCSVARGTLSSLKIVDKTATEIKESRQRSSTTVRDIQLSLRCSLCSLVDSLDRLCSLYRLCPEGKVETAITFGDSLIEDAATERVRDMEEVRAGLMLPREFRQKWFDETPDAAMASLAELKGGE